MGTVARFTTVIADYESVTRRSRQDPKNPTEQVGTFPLPESQLDRFLMRIELGYPDEKGWKLLKGKELLLAVRDLLGIPLPGQPGQPENTPDRPGVRGALFVDEARITAAAVYVN